MKITAKGVAKGYVAFCLCMNANVFLRIFGALTPSPNGRVGVVNNPVMFAFTAILVFATGALFVRGYKRSSLSLLNNPWLTGLYLWSLCSALWAPLPSMVLRASLATWSLLLCGVISARYLQAEETADVFCDVVFCLALLSLVFELFFPLVNTMAPGWTGVYGEKNHMGIGMGLGCIAQFASTRKWTWWRGAQLCFLLTLLVLSQSMTSMIFVFATGSVFLVIKLPRWVRPLALASVSGFVILAFSFIPNLTELLFGAAGKNTNLTGRDVIWRFTLEQWAKRPLAGYGLYSFWESQDTLIRQWLGWNPGEAHNGFLEIGVTLGAVGEMLLLGALVSGVLLILKARRSGHRTAAIWLTLCWVAIMIDNLTEADFLIPGPLWFMYCLVYFTTYMEVRRGAVRSRVVVPEQPSVPLAGRMPAFGPGWRRGIRSAGDAMKPGLSRRSFLGQGSLALASVGPCRTAWPGLRAFTEANFPLGRLLSEPVAVPSDFVGMHAHRWPVGSPLSPPPTYPFGAARSHDYDGASWNCIHVAPGQFDWRALDLWVQVHKAAGRSLIYTVYGTPAWASSVPQVRDPYGRPGGSSAPQSLEPLREFIEELVTRYNGGGTRNIDILETWNEPTFDTPNAGSFWIGTPVQLAAMGRQIWHTAKAVDPHMSILSPGFSGNLAGLLDYQAPELRDAVSSPVYQYLAASDGAGGAGGDWCDGIAFHCYNAPLSGPNWGFLLEIRRMNLMLNLMGVRLPVYNTEIGFLLDDPFQRLSTQGKADTLRRFAAVHASQGVRGMYFYSHDDEYVGNPALHPAVAKAIGDLHASLAGKTLEQVTVTPSGNARVETTEGTFLW